MKLRLHNEDEEQGFLRRIRNFVEVSLHQVYAGLEASFPGPIYKDQESEAIEEIVQMLVYGYDKSGGNGEDVAESVIHLLRAVKLRAEIVKISDLPDTIEYQGCVKHSVEIRIRFDWRAIGMDYTVAHHFGEVSMRD